MKNKGRKAIAGFLSNLLLGVLMGVSMCAVGVSMLFAVIKSDSWQTYLIFAIAILEYVILTAAHEAGHLVFGLISGYSFCSYRIGSLMCVKLPEGIRLRKMSLAGTGGQCLMIPPEAKDGKIPVFLYNMGGVLVNLIIACLLLVLYIPVRSMPVLPYAFILGAEFSLIMVLFNGLPLKVGGIANDGMNAFSLRKDIHANDAFRKQLLINGEQTRGIRLSDMPDEWFSMPENTDMNNPICASVPVFYCNRLIDSENFDEAERSILNLINGDNGLIGMYRSMLISDLIYCLLLKGENDRAAKYYTTEQRAAMNSLRSISSILRTEYALAICKIHGAKKAEKVKKSFDKLAKKYPYPTDIALDCRLISLIEEKCNSEQ